MPLMDHAEEDRFIRGLAAEPEDEALRLVYADWLEENGHPARAKYLRAEVKHFKSTSRKKSDKWSKAKGIDSVWAKMVSRPPFGILRPGLTFDNEGRPPITPADLAVLEEHWEAALPPDYAAFLLLHNGGVPSREYLWWPWEGTDHYDAVRFFSVQERPLRRRKPYWQMSASDLSGNQSDDEDIGPLLLIGTISYQEDLDHEGEHFLGIVVLDDANTRILDLVLEDRRLTRSRSDTHDHDTFVHLLSTLTDKMTPASPR